MTAERKSRAPVPPAVVERLKAIVGPAGFIDQPFDMEFYCTAFRDGWHGRVPVVLRPQTTAEVAAIVKICAETGTAIVPQGGNTGVTGGGQPHDDLTEVIVSTQRMKAVRKLDVADDTITVEAGVVLAEIQRIAADANRLFPLSLGAEGSCQIGGNLSTNAGGVQVLRYGNARNLVLGLEVVLPDGQIWDGLRALRKDNTGYDLKHLFIGAEGTLGIITAAVLRLFPKPSAVETAWLAVPDPAAALKLLSHMRGRLGDAISGFELIQRSILAFLLTGVPGHSDPLPAPSPWYVLAEATGQGGVDSLSEPFADAIGGAHEAAIVTDAVIAQSLSQGRRFWKMREEFTEAQKKAGRGVKHDVSVPVSAVPAFIAAVDAALMQAYPGIQPCTFGHLGDGNMHCNPVQPPDADGDRFYAERGNINRIVHDIANRMGGSISAEHGIGQLRLEENEHYKNPIELGLMRTLKRTLDPKTIMNPGKVLRLG